LLHDGAGLTDGQLLAEFVRDRDDAAFASLVKRHAPMVFGVCRRLIQDTHVAEDAFQAVFLVLARRASSVRPREQVGNWLYGVAFRTALKARSSLARHRSREKQVHAMPHPVVLPMEVWHDVTEVLDEELARLSDKLRSAIVLCDLEGRAQRDVAKQMGLALATLAGRLASARRLLASRLSKRGITLSGGALATTIATNSAHGTVPPLLIAAAVRMAQVASIGARTAVAVPGQVVQLSEGVMRMMFLGKLRTLTCCVAAGLLLAGGSFWMSGLSASEPETPAKTPDASPPSTPKKSRLTDAEFLRRVCLDLRGQLPTEIEGSYFVGDPDIDKRSKVLEWLIEEKDARAEQALRATRYRLFRLQLSDRAIAENWEARSLGELDKHNRVTNFLRMAQLASEAEKRYKGAGEEFSTKVGVDLLESLEPTFRAQSVAELDELYDLVGARTDDSDVAFLQRACQDARGTTPTCIEIEYFKGDKDPKKREKLLDLLLKDPAVAKRLGNAWKQKLLQPAAEATALRVTSRLYLKKRLEAELPAHLDRLLDQLLKEKRTDEQILESLATATLGRLPTESERKLVHASVAKQEDKRAAWRDVIRTFSSTSEAKQHGEELTPRPQSKNLEKK
jgi:RNA polymerase sigma factor (sigma-70 family)